MRLAAISVLVACAAPATTPIPAPAREAPPAWQARPAGGTRAIDPGVPATSALLDAAGCAECHAPIVAEWSRSRHAVAWTNSIFQREWSARPQRWCINCHAPLATQQLDLDGAHARQGVDCATCHLRDGKLVSSTRGARSPHDTIADASFGTPAFCADCHEFTFPVLSHDGGAALSMTRHPMQTTVSSFRAGPYADKREGCLACHGTRDGHGFLGADDRGMREAALEVTWCQNDGGKLAIAVANVAAGHTVPTGDIHRHMYLRAWRSSAPEAMFQAYFGRRFEPADDGGKRTIWDSTIAPGETKRFEVAAGALGGSDDGEPINLELVYVYIENEFPRRATDEPTTASLVRRRAPLADIARCRSP